ncbi:MAG TPA: biotin--[acetyl-CoA-carboxylase] ligase [Flavobacterium sp.]|jgi:BirA family biotin operon repressor/biotin-[acetyl-CoA-carboxylase] ligase
MRLIKLDAIDSTNDFLKDLSRAEVLESYTVVTARAQTKGKGQMGAKWEVQAGKNLTASILINDAVADISQIYDLNIVVALSIADVLEEYNIASISIKWPNDIMAGVRKCGGILIENSIHYDGRIDCIVGIGLNVNQTNFEHLPKATSMEVESGNTFDIEGIIRKIAEHLRRNLSQRMDPIIVRERYYDKLFKKDVPMPFRNHKETFMGIIRGIDEVGSLLIQREDDSVQAYRLKEITMLY